jgi:hypothetical protein
MLEGWHTVASGPALAGVTAWSTVITVVSLYNAAHTPLFTKALNQVVVDKLVYACAVVVFATFSQLAPLFVLNSHRTTDPTFPLKVITPLLAVAQTVASLLVTPATVDESIFIDTVSLLSAHMPLLIVHTKEYVPGTRLVTEVLYRLAFANTVVVGPESCDHVPVPLVGLFPLSWMLEG